MGWYGVVRDFDIPARKQISWISLLVKLAPWSECMAVKISHGTMKLWNYASAVVWKGLVSGWHCNKKKKNTVVVCFDQNVLYTTFTSFKGEIVLAYTLVWIGSIHVNQSGSLSGYLESQDEISIFSRLNGRNISVTFQSAYFLKNKIASDADQNPGWIKGKAR